jgi:hypothetical protein
MRARSPGAANRLWTAAAVRVDDVRVELAQDGQHAGKRRVVVARRELAAELRQMLDLRGRREQVPHVAFALAERAMHQVRRESAGGEALRQHDRLNRRPADVQAGDEPQHAHGPSLYHSCP